MTLAAIARKLVGGKDHDIFRNMTLLALGAGAAKLIDLAAMPVLTRVYGPEHFGVLSVFMSLVAILAPLVSLRYVVAMPLPHHDRLAINLLALSLSFIFVNSLVMAAVLLVAGPWILPLLSMEILLPYWWLIALGVLGTSFYESLTLWATRKKAFKPLARSQVWQASVGAMLKLGLGWLAVKPVGLLVGQVVQQGGGSITLTKRFWGDLTVLGRDISGRRMRLLFRKYGDLPKYRLPSQFLMIFSMQAPLLFSAALFGAATTGQLGLAIVTLSLPIQLFGQTMGQAYFGEISKIGKYDVERVRQLTIDVVKRMLLLGVVPCLVLLIGGPWLFSTFFGAEWEQSGVFARILSIYILAQFISAPLVNVFTLYEKQRYFFSINLARFCLVLFSFALSHILSLSPAAAITLYASLMALHYTSVNYRVFRMINKLRGIA